MELWQICWIEPKAACLGSLPATRWGAWSSFGTPELIQREFPDGVRELADGGTWNTIAGQPTDDSEMALMLARMLADEGMYEVESARNAYLFWLNSHPFDVGRTIRSAASKVLNHPLDKTSQANGAMMRVSHSGSSAPTMNWLRWRSGRDRMPRSRMYT